MTPCPRPVRSPVRRATLLLLLGLAITACDNPFASSSPILEHDLPSLSFDPDRAEATFQIRNSGDSELSYTASSPNDWIHVVTSTGTVVPGGSADLRIQVDRTGFPTSVQSGAVHVESDGGDVVVAVTMEVDRSVRLEVTNHLVGAVAISVNDETIGQVPAGETRQQNVGEPDEIVVKVELIRPTLEGRALGDRVDGITGTIDTRGGGRVSLEMDHRLGDSWFFAPLITNETSARLLMAVNWGLQSENRCRCVVVAGAERTYFGYYRLFSNTQVVGFRDGSNYSGSYIYWEDFTNTSFPDSGTRELLATSAPSPPAHAAGQLGAPGAVVAPEAAAPMPGGPGVRAAGRSAAGALAIEPGGARTGEGLALMGVSVVRDAGGGVLTRITSAEMTPVGG